MSPMTMIFHLHVKQTIQSGELLTNISYLPQPTIDFTNFSLVVSCEWHKVSCSSEWKHNISVRVMSEITNIINLQRVYLTCFIWNISTLSPKYPTIQSILDRRKQDRIQLWCTLSKFADNWDQVFSAYI